MRTEPFSAVTLTTMALSPTTRLLPPEIATLAVASAAVAVTRTEVVRAATETTAPGFTALPLIVASASELFELSGVTYAFTV